MPAITPFRTTPSLGPDLWQTSLEFYWDTVSKKVGDTTVTASYQQGSSVIGSDGHRYVFVKTVGAIASGATVILTEPAMTAATGAGAYTAPVTTGAVAIPAGSFIHIRRTAL